MLDVTQQNQGDGPRVDNHGTAGSFHIRTFTRQSLVRAETPGTDWHGVPMQRTPTSSLRSVDRPAVVADTRPAQDFMRALAGTVNDIPPAYTPELNLALVAYVRRLRDEALPPERVVVQVKELANRTVDGCGRSGLLWPIEARRIFMADVVRNCIRAYYQVD